MNKPEFLAPMMLIEKAEYEYLKSLESNEQEVSLDNSAELVKKTEKALESFFTYSLVNDGMVLGNPAEVLANRLVEAFKMNGVNLTTSYKNDRNLAIKVNLKIS